jgi:hypothetical protein
MDCVVSQTCAIQAKVMADTMHMAIMSRMATTTAGILIIVLAAAPFLFVPTPKAVVAAAIPAGRASTPTPTIVLTKLLYRV